MSHNVDIVAFGPHPDDVELFAGGLVALRAAAGDNVVIVDLTAGEMASRGSVDDRRDESLAATRILGVSGRVCLALPDGRIDEHDDTQVRAIVDILRSQRPRLVLGPWSHERHPDHEATHRLLRRACFLSGLIKYETGIGPWRPVETLWYPMRYETTPSFLVDITSVVDRKYDAIACHRSQLHSSDAGSSVTQPHTLVGSRDTVAVLRARDTYYGSMCGSAAAEPYVSTRVPVLQNPVDAFPDGDVHFFSRQNS